MKFTTIVLLSLFFVALVWSSCNIGIDKESKREFGQLQINFSHNMQMDTFMYVNASENPFLVSEIQYFISDVKLYKSNGDIVLLDDFEDIHYVDTDITETLEYILKDSVPVGDYTKVSFTFGINEEKNQPMIFVNPPESFMFWPAYLGGGFHYMKLNGKWINDEGDTKVFNFHLGIGQEYDDNRNIISFHQNFFEVELPNSIISFKSGMITNMDVVMNIQSWFTGPHDYDFNEWGGKIMQNQKAMKLGCENGYDVFSISNIEYKDLK